MLQPSGERSRRIVPSSDLDECGNQLPHHLPEEVGSGEPDENHILVFADLNEVDRDPALFLVGALVRIRCKVVKPCERSCRLLHRLEVERIPDPPDPWFQKRAAYTADLVKVYTLGRVVPGMKPVGSALGPCHIDLGGDPVVQLPDDPRRLDRRGKTQVGHLTECVYARIGAPRAAEITATKSLR